MIFQLADADIKAVADPDRRGAIETSIRIQDLDLTLPEEKATSAGGLIPGAQCHKGDVM